MFNLYIEIIFVGKWRAIPNPRENFEPKFWIREIRNRQWGDWNLRKNDAGSEGEREFESWQQRKGTNHQWLEFHLQWVREKNHSVAGRASRSCIKGQETWNENPRREEQRQSNHFYLFNNSFFIDIVLICISCSFQLVLTQRDSCLEVESFYSHKNKQ